MIKPADRHRPRLARFSKYCVDTARRFNSVPYFGYVQGHADLTASELVQLRGLVAIDSREIVAEYEQEFARLLGDGRTVSYASARMGFYDLMRVLEIAEGDEVILTGATCAVMVNAVLRVGATPVFSDVDPDTLGSSAHAISSCMTPRTKMIVAQHSFGIPCDIAPIVELAKRNSVFLLEDCALALESKSGHVSVGNFGDAALFSTNNSKPLNTLIGGMIYTRDPVLADRLRIAQADCRELPNPKKNALWERLLLERHYCDPDRYGRMGLIDLLTIARQKILREEGPFLTDDFGARLHSTYPYPAQLPTFLAALGLMQLRRWPARSLERKEMLGLYLDVLNDGPAAGYLPAAYRNARLDIVPLRVAWSQPDGALVRQSLRRHLQVSWTWFMQPIVASDGPLEQLNYSWGSCPVAEKIGPGMINLPCNLSKRNGLKLMDSLWRELGRGAAMRGKG